MPELPEVEVLRRDLDREVVGKKVKAVDVDGMRSVRRHHNRKQFAQRLVDHKITGVERKGKYLLLRLDGDDVSWSTSACRGSCSGPRARATRWRSTPTS